MRSGTPARWPRPKPPSPSWSRPTATPPQNSRLGWRRTCPRASPSSPCPSDLPPPHAHLEPHGGAPSEPGTEKVGRARSGCSRTECLRFERLVSAVLVSAVLVEIDDRWAADTKAYMQVGMPGCVITPARNFSDHRLLNLHTPDHTRSRPMRRPRRPRPETTPRRRTRLRRGQARWIAGSSAPGTNRRSAPEKPPWRSDRYRPTGWCGGLMAVPPGAGVGGLRARVRVAGAGADRRDDDRRPRTEDRRGDGASRACGEAGGAGSPCARGGPSPPETADGAVSGEDGPGAATGAAKGARIAAGDGAEERPARAGLGDPCRAA